MNQDHYLQRLKSIRERYGCQASQQYPPKFNEFLYPVSQLGGDISHKRVHEENYPKVRPQPQKTPRFDYLVEKPQEHPRHERFYSMEKVRASHYDPMMNQVPNMKLNEAQFKRQDNFNHFISDLDRKIQEKDRLLNDKYQQNAKIIRKIEECPEDNEYRALHKYSSSRDIRCSTPPPPSNLDFIPRKAYEKSISFRNYYDNRQNDMPFPPAQQQLLPHKRDHHGPMIGETSSKNYPQPNLQLISRKLDSGTPMKENYSTGKLDSIQQRINSVLKQMNR